MKARAHSVADYQELAESYARDNEKLRAENEALNDTIAQHEATIVDLEIRIRNADVQLRYREESTGDIPPDADKVVPEGENPPEKGDLRFYKKKHSTPKRDVMIHVGDCGCNNWESAHAADKAKKGIAKLEGRSNWSLMQHCASCEGGGMWRVRW